MISGSNTSKSDMLRVSDKLQEVIPIPINYLSTNPVSAVRSNPLLFFNAKAMTYSGALI